MWVTNGIDSQWITKPLICNESHFGWSHFIKLGGLGNYSIKSSGAIYFNLYFWASDDPTRNKIRHGKSMAAFLTLYSVLRAPNLP